VAGNKVADPDDVEYLRRRGRPALLPRSGTPHGCAPPERGRQADGGTRTRHRAGLDAVLAALDATERDWAAYHRDTVHFHLRNAQAWANQSLGVDLTDQVDPDYVPGPVTADIS